MRPAFDAYASPVGMLQAILDGPRFGEVEGVHFDFRHDKLPSAAAWHAPGGAQPFGVVFPWDRTLWDGDANLAARYVTNGQNERGWKVTHVYPGDRVSVDRLARLYRAAGKPPYADDHDTHSISAYLIVTRPNGQAERIDDSIQFNARDAMGPASPYFYAGDDGLDEWVGDFRVTYSKVARRLDRLNETVKHGPAREWVELANEAQGEVDGDLDALAEVLRADGDHLFAPDLTRLIDLATTVGYALAKAESAPVLDNASKRTRPASKARRAITDPVREAAKADVLANPKTTQTACARRLATKLNRDQRAIEKLIAPLFSWVVLPGGSKEKRAHRSLTAPPSDRRPAGAYVDPTLLRNAEFSHSSIDATEGTE